MAEINNFWDVRYGNEEYIYGQEPNEFFAEQISKLEPGIIILPCEGEGRNAVYAALHGWKVMAFDSSTAGKEKALKLADAKGVKIEYLTADADSIDYAENSADVVAFVYAHFAPELRAKLCRKALNWLKPGGKIIMEVFHTKQLQNSSGGPKDIAMLCTEEIVRSDFEGAGIDLLEAAEIMLSEGKFHRGKADVVRFVGTKIG